MRAAGPHRGRARSPRRGERAPLQGVRLRQGGCPAHWRPGAIQRGCAGPMECERPLAVALKLETGSALLALSEVPYHGAPAVTLLWFPSHPPYATCMSNVISVPGPAPQRPEPG